MRKNIIYYIVYLTVIFHNVIAFGQNDVYLSVRAGGSGFIGVGIGGFDLSRDPDGMVKKTIAEDLNQSGLFQVKTIPDSLSKQPLALFQQWKNAGAQCYLLGEENNKKNVTVRLFDLKTAAVLLNEEYIVDTARPWYTAHVIVDDMIQVLTGLRGSMASQISFVRKYKGGEEIFICDADGRNERQLTFSKSFKQSPAWSADSKYLAYSTLSRTNWTIMAINVSTGQSSDITRSMGLNSTPAWSPVDPNKIAFTSSRDGNPEIYTCNINGKEVRRITNHPRIDTSPSWSPDGSQMAFVSDRTGTPLVYIMNSDGSNSHRLTPTPKSYEDSPSWSPRGDKIVFVSLSDYNSFDIATVSASGEGVVIITYGEGSNEDPCWSPDGLRMVFTSTRTGSRMLYIMNSDGSQARPLIPNGDCFSAAWSYPANGNDIRVSSKR